MIENNDFSTRTDNFTSHYLDFFALDFLMV